MELFFFVLQSTKKWMESLAPEWRIERGETAEEKRGGRKTDPSLYLLLPKTLFFFFSLSLSTWNRRRVP